MLIASTDHAGNQCFPGNPFLATLHRPLNMLKRRLDMLMLLAAVVVFNAHLVGLGSSSWALFLPSAVNDGQWWRLFTHPFVHVTWYHLLLDAGAFFLLYDGLEEKSTAKRLLLLPICAAGGVLAALAFSPQIDTAGLCGLSGTAHGLMAFSGLEMMRAPGKRGPGKALFTLVAAKSLYELVTGTVFFDFMHMGLCGAPVAACHFGGVAGGTAAFLVFSVFSGATKTERHRCCGGATRLNRPA